MISEYFFVSNSFVSEGTPLTQSLSRIVLKTFVLDIVIAIFANYWLARCNLQVRAWANMMQWNTHMMEFKEVMEARKGRLAIPIGVI